MSQDGTRKRMEEGRLYFPGDTDILKEQEQYMELLYDYNATRPGEKEKRRALLEKMMGSVGQDCYIEPPLHCNWGGKHVFMGNLVYANFNLTLGKMYGSGQGQSSCPEYPLAMTRSLVREALSQRTYRPM